MVKDKNDDKIKRKQETQWETEAIYDLPLTLEDLITDAPFHDSSDDQGNSYTAAARLPEWVRRRVKKLIEMDGTPYEIESDVIRDCIHIGLQIASMRYRLGPDWVVETKMAKTLDQSGASRRIKRQFDNLCEGLQELYRDGDVEQAANRLSEYVVAAAVLDNEWHRDRLFRLIRENKLVIELAAHCKDHVRRLILGEKDDKSK